MRKPTRKLTPDEIIAAPPQAGGPEALAAFNADMAAQETINSEPQEFGDDILAASFYDADRPHLGPPAGDEFDLEVERLRLRPGDILVLSVAADTPVERITQINKGIRNVLTECGHGDVGIIVKPITDVFTIINKDETPCPSPSSAKPRAATASSARPSRKT